MSLKILILCGISMSPCLFPHFPYPFLVSPDALSTGVTSENSFRAPSHILCQPLPHLMVKIKYALAGYSYV